MNAKTYTGGARAALSAVIATVRRQIKTAEKKGNWLNNRAVIDGEGLLKWLLDADQRYNKKARGLGK